MRLPSGDTEGKERSTAGFFGAEGAGCAGFTALRVAAPAAAAAAISTTSEALARRRIVASPSRSGLAMLVLLGPPVLLEPPVERAARQPERRRGVADVAAIAVERLLDQVLLDLLEGHLLEPARRRGAVEAEVERRDARAARQQHGALDGVVELAHVARPRMAFHGAQRGGVEAGDVLAIAARVLAAEALGERLQVLAALAQRRQVDL